MSKFPIIRDEALIWEIDPTARHPVVSVYLLPEERRRFDAAMTEFIEVQLMISRKVADLEIRESDT